MAFTMGIIYDLSHACQLAYYYPRRYFFSTLAPDPGFRKSHFFAGGPCMHARAIFSGVSGIGSGMT